VVGEGSNPSYIYEARSDSCRLWRNKLNSLIGAAAAGKPAPGFVSEPDGQSSDITGPEHLGPEVTGGVLAELSPEEQGREILSIILQELDDDKAEDIVTIDLAGKSDIADAMVVASGRSQRHVGAMADQVMRRLKASGLGRVMVEGASACDWVLIDAGDVIVHLFRPEVRSFYNLERVWSEAARMPIKPDA